MLEARAIVKHSLRAAIPVLAAFSLACGASQESRPGSLPTSVATAVATRPAISTAVVLGQPTPIPLEFTDFSFRPISANEVGISACTKGRPVGTTLRVAVYRDSVPANVDPDKLDQNKWQIIKELGVPCFNTNGSNPDWPIWRVETYQPGNYLIRAEVRPDEAKGSWIDPSVVRRYSLYNLVRP